MGDAMVGMLHGEIPPVSGPVRIAAASTLEVDGVMVQPHHRHPIRTVTVLKRWVGEAP